MHDLNHDEKSGLCSTLPALVNYMEARYDWLDSNIRNAKVATLTMEWWKVLKAARDNRRFPDHDLWWCFFLSGLDFIMPYDAGAEAKESSSDDLMCKGPLPLLFDSMSVEASVAMMKEVMLYEKAALDTATATNVQPKRKKAEVQNQTVCQLTSLGDHGIGEQPKVRGSRTRPRRNELLLISWYRMLNFLGQMSRGSAIGCKASRGTCGPLSCTSRDTTSP